MLKVQIAFMQDPVGVNIRVLLTVLGIGCAMVSGALMALGWTSTIPQLSLALGLSIALISCGLEQFQKDSPFCDRFSSSRIRILVGSLCVLTGAALVAVVIGNILQSFTH
jgi:hypothetical protein